MTILPGASLRAVFLSHLHQLVLPAAEADLLGVGQAGPVFGVGVGVVEVVVPVVEAGARHLVGQLAAGQGSLPEAGVHAGLVERERVGRGEHAHVGDDRGVVARMAVAGG